MNDNSVGGPPGYGATNEGLTAFVSDVLTAIDRRDDDGVAALGRSSEIAHPETVFEVLFGRGDVAQIANAYRVRRDRFGESWLSARLRGLLALVDSPQRIVEVESGGTWADGSAAPTVRLHLDGVFTLPGWRYLDGAWRWLGPRQNLLPHDTGPAGLIALHVQMFAAIAQLDLDELDLHLRMLNLPDPVGWFTEQFGRGLGQAVACDYRGMPSIAEAARALGATSMAERVERIRASRRPLLTLFLEEGSEQETEVLANLAMRADEGSTHRYCVELVTDAVAEPPDNVSCQNRRDPIVVSIHGNPYRGGEELARAAVLHARRETGRSLVLYTVSLGQGEYGPWAHVEGAWRWLGPMTPLADSRAMALVMRCSKPAFEDLREPASYASTPEGLEQLLRDALYCAGMGFKAGLDVLCRAMQLEDAGPCLVELFGEEVGCQLAAERAHRHLPAEAWFEFWVAEDYLELGVEPLSAHSSDTRQLAALALLQPGARIFISRHWSLAHRGRDERWGWVHHGGRWRWLGPCEGLDHHPVMSLDLWPRALDYPGNASLFDATPEGLLRLGRALLAPRDRFQSQYLLGTLTLVEPAEWFNRVFGAGIVTGELIDGYQRDRENIAERAEEQLSNLRADEWEVSVLRLSDVSTNSSEMARPVPLYALRLHESAPKGGASNDDESEDRWIFPLAFDAGAWRIVDASAVSACGGREQLEKAQWTCRRQAQIWKRFATKSRSPARFRVLALAPNGQHGLAACQNQAGGPWQLDVWDIDADSCLQLTLPDVQAATFSSDGKAAYCAGGRSLSIIELEDGMEQSLQATSMGPEQSPEVALAVTDQAAVLVACAESRINHRASDAGPSVASVRFVLWDGTEAMLASKTVENLDLGRAVHAGMGPREFRDEGETLIVGSPCGRRIAVAERQSLRVWELGRERPLLAVEIDDRRSSAIAAIAFSHDGASLVSRSMGGTLRMHELDSDQVRWTTETLKNALVLEGRFKGRWPGARLAMSADRRLLVSAFRDGTVWIHDAGTGEMLGRCQADGPLCTCSISADGGTILVDGDGGLSVFRLAWERSARRDAR